MAVNVDGLFFGARAVQQMLTQTPVGGARPDRHISSWHGMVPSARCALWREQIQRRLYDPAGRGEHAKDLTSAMRWRRVRS